ncbi:CUGBP Elav-like family member 2 [Manis javanica]|nr:CUGBP Elav-like family member 2 [Manis javanica]
MRCPKSAVTMRNEELLLREDQIQDKWSYEPPESIERLRDQILGYEIASLNRSLQQRPNGAVCQATPAAKT